ncbi:RNA polymerase sigma factor [Flavivirga rizhaonensis]|uniref:RNA polymerase sigma factor n=1 Tax=Flavivirga rizhaonensis TaxID=2559571 RepID=A0A4S1DRG3_9FLAO|nr:RNA polymerase sigma factor [Flavivirga rizhaonensis]TGV00491.1 RNA polymerase sigma factor [Flavivirga rizhaonensis]
MNKTEFKLKVFSLSEHLFPMVSRMLGNNTNAEDAIQEIMMKLWVKRKQIGQHPNITGFVFLTARNYCIDLMRKKRLEIDDSSLQLEILKSENGQEQLEWKELNLNTIIKKIVKSLPEQQREVIIMRDLDGYEFIEIAAATQLKVEHVRVLLSRARKQISIKLEKAYSYERG